MSGDVKETIARTSADVVRWIIDNEHYRGYWTGSIDHPKEFCLEGDSARIRIPARIHQPGLIRGTDFEKTKRVYEPTEAGRRALDREDRE